jgi:hypothetical protein
MRLCEPCRKELGTPEIEDFFEAVKKEAAYQRQRWAEESDAGKTDADWFWLIGYLAGKALHNPGGNREKKLHRIITVAAAACNWWASVRGTYTKMRPGADPAKVSGAEGA